LAPSARCRS